MAISFSLCVPACFGPDGGRRAPVIEAPPPAEAPPAWASPLGTGVGASPLRAEVSPGRYDVSVAFRQAKTPRTEVSFKRTVLGRAWVDLQPSGAFEACLGVAEQTNLTTSPYGSADGEWRHDERLHRQLTHWRGTWTTDAEGARLAVTHLSIGTCEDPADRMTAHPAGTMRCGTLADVASSEATLACRPVDGLPEATTIALDLCTPASARPWALRVVPFEATEPDPTLACGPWLLFGDAPGLTVRSEDGPGQAAPSVSFRRGTEPMRAAEWTVTP